MNNPMTAIINKVTGAIVAVVFDFNVNAHISLMDISLTDCVLREVVYQAWNGNIAEKMAQYPGASCYVRSSGVYVGCK